MTRPKRELPLRHLLTITSIILLAILAIYNGPRSNIYLTSHIGKLFPTETFRSSELRENGRLQLRNDGKIVLPDSPTR